MSAIWTIKRGRIVTASLGVLSAWACTVADKKDYTFTDNPEGATGGKGGSSMAGKGGSSAGTGGSSAAGKGGTSGEAGMVETGGRGGRGGRGNGGRGTLLGGRGGRGSVTGGTAGESGAAGQAGGGNAGESGEGGAGGEAGSPVVSVCGNGKLEAGEQCDLGTNNGVTACTYGQTSCTVCTKSCKRAAGTTTYCGDGKIQASHEQCDDGNTVTEGCTYGDTACKNCDSTCKSSVRDCGDGKLNGDTLTSIFVESLGFALSCGGAPYNTLTMQYYLNYIAIPNFPQSLCTCTAVSSIATATITDAATLASIRPTGNIFEARASGSFTPVLGWVRLTFIYQDGTRVQVTPFNFDGEAASSGTDLCFNSTTYAVSPEISAGFDVPGVEQCDGSSNCTSCSEPQTTPAFVGNDIGPAFPGWAQCAGFLDTAGVNDIPDTGWGAGCLDAGLNHLRLVCGPSLSTYRYMDVPKNVLRDGLSSDPETDLVFGTGDQNGATFALSGQEIYASSPVDSTYSWWGTGSGCDESMPGIVIDPASAFGCSSWEVTDCFGQNLTGDRHFWVYVAQ